MQLLPHPHAPGLLKAQVFGEDDTGAWLVRPLMKVVNNFYAAALAAEVAGHSQGSGQGPLESCGSELVALFGVARKRTGLC